MKIAMTHDQADFDAIASLFAAAILDGSVPVLPQKLNRNIQSFLILYGSEINLVEIKDLPEEAITEVTVVDTQSMLTLRGMGQNTLVRFIDHHPLRAKETEKKPGASTQPKKTIQIVELGATTTHFVEEMQHKRVSISPVQATLLLLGIYEDTGSLTYSKTTARDIRAAAWLLEQGAMLSTIPEYLNPPLDPQQVVVYDKLLDNMETLTIKGHRVMVSYAEVPTKVDEISTLAHKIRDLFDPDAVFILVKTPEGLRLIARSSTDDIDVGEITAGFGGGGHTRAASALLRPNGKDEILVLQVKARLLHQLDHKIKAAIPVSKLMSRKPLVLQPEMPVEQAAQFMLKYGYEGFPVAQDGKVIGLLTRRSVDRAIRHKLNFKVGNLMDAGSYSVQPADPIQSVQNAMTESGWGQIPVIDPATGKIIGIVTRTDILKILTSKRKAFASSKNIEKVMQERLPAPTLSLITTIANQAAAQNTPAYLVGGFVRDLLLGSPSNDIDCVLEGDAIKIGEALAAKFGGRLNSHRRFGTARWYLEESQLDLTNLPPFVDLITARQEFYEQPTVLPSVEYGNIKHDLHRRDFTINTLAIRVDGDHFGELHDYYGGKNDLDRKLIRVLHSLSFIDDPTRMLRAARYETRYGFTIEPRTLQLMSEAGNLLGHLSPERIRHEIDLILLEKEPAKILARLAEWEMLGKVSPGLVWGDEIADGLAAGLTKEIPEAWGEVIDLADQHDFLNLAYALWFAKFSELQINEIQQRLGFSVRLYNSLLDTAKILGRIEVAPPSDPFGWACLLEESDPVCWYVCWIYTKDPRMEMFVKTWRHISPITDGNALIKRGLRPGPYFQDILSSLKKARLNSDVTTDAEEITMLEKLIRELKIGK